MTRTRTALALALVVAASLFATRPAHAEIQTSTHQFTGKFLVGITPLGAQIRFDGTSVAGYKLQLDFSGKLKEMDKLTIWLGGGFNYTAGTYGFVFGNHDVQLWAFVMLTLEKLLKIPLVPFVRAGIGGDVLLYNASASGTLSGGAFAIRMGGGIHYYIIKQLGMGFETNFTFGPGFYPAAVHGPCGGGNTTCVNLYGNWDFGFGIRLHF